DTDLTITEIAFASGFGSVRQFNRACLEIFRGTPRELRARRRRSDRLAADGGLALRLPLSAPLDWDAALAYFGPRLIAGVEAIEGDVYRRTIVVDGDPGVLELSPGGPDHLVLRAHLPHWEGLIHIVEGARRIVNLDEDVAAGAERLRGDPVIGPLIEARPDLPIPGTWDPFEVGIRAIVGQQVSVAGASTMIGRLAHRHGTAVPGLEGLELTHTFPAPEVLADADLGGIGLTGARERAIRAFAAGVATGELRLDRSTRLEELVEAITAIPGLGPWTAHYIALRMGERDAFPATDLGLRRALGRLEPASELLTPSARAEPWRPWRALAAVYLWFGA
ncbi:MAG: 3-methyladenine DNA glycosylase 2, partial [Actinobacteria bacterium]|nr:3-methyladenine DNA glycosylase 2 [Actinomycetota bacterium]